MEEAKNTKVIGAIPGWILFTITGWAVYQLVGGVPGTIIDGNLGTGCFVHLCSIGASLLYVLIYERANKNTFDGCYKTDCLKLGFAILAVYPLWQLISTIFEVATGAQQLGFTWNAVTLSLSAGVCEETTYRTVPVAHMMRCYNDEQKIPLVCLLTSLVFGLIHLMNLTGGAAISYTLVQVYHAFSAGMLLCAAYLRTGSIFPSIVAHTLNDFIGFLAVNTHSAEGLMTDASKISVLSYVSGIVSSTVFLAVALYAIRPAKRGEILKLWAKKWCK